jgi:hypothetical protein
MFINVQTCLLSDVITSGNTELLFRSHNTIDLRRGQEERFGVFRPAGDIQIPSALERWGWQRVKRLYESNCTYPLSHHSGNLNFSAWFIKKVLEQKKIKLQICVK